jgi:cobalt-zinc-cadmium efflux system protein
MGNNHSHHGHDHGDLKGRRLGITIVLNLLITVSQVIGGLVSGSLSLLSDAAHNFSDVIALIISWIADRLTHKKYSSKQTYGFKRAEVIAALINVVTIIVIAVNIFIEGISRLIEPQEVAGVTVILLAGLSIVINGLSVLIIKGDAENNMNMRSAYLHLFSDMLTSIAVLIGGIMMYYFKIYWIDGVISLVISAYLLYSSGRLLFDTLRVLMQFTPSHIELESIQEVLEGLDYVEDIHHVHVWQLTDDDIHFSAHITFVNDLSLSEVSCHLNAIKDLLINKYGIGHSTLEAEHQACGDTFIVDERGQKNSDHNHDEHNHGHEGHKH